MRRSVLVMLWSVATFMGCGQTFMPGGPVVLSPDAGAVEDMTGDTAGEMTGDMPAIRDMSRDPTGPEILELSANPPTIDPQISTTISATVTDPDGFADIGGGRLLTRDGGVVGAFEGTGGVFQISLDWEDITGIQDVSFDQTLAVVLVAEFFDAANHRSMREVTLTLTCNEGLPACQGQCGTTLCGGACVPAEVEGPKMGTCDGACVSFDSDPSHCGMCGRTCTADQRCREGACVAQGDALSLFEECQNTAQCVAGECRTLPGTPNVCVASCEDSDCPAGTECSGRPDSPFRVCIRRCQSGAECPGSTQCTPPNDFFSNLGLPPEGGFCFVRMP